MKKILLFLKYGDWEENSYYRYFQYFNILNQSGFEVKAYPFFSRKIEKTYFHYGKINFLQKIYSYIKRMYVLITEKNFHGVWLDLELFPYIPFELENLFFSIDMPILLDIQNSFYYKYSHGVNYIQKKFLSQKIPLWIARSQVITVSNYEIEGFAKPWNQNIHLLPFGFKESFLPIQKKTQATHEFAIGWTGSRYSSRFLISIFDCLRELKRFFPIKLYLVGGEKSLAYPVKTEIFDWNKEIELSLLSKADILINPLPMTLREKGNPSLKLLKYMTLGLPIITSPSGGAKMYIEHSVNGFIAYSQDDWYLYLRQLLEDEVLRQEFGKQAKLTLETSFNFQNSVDSLVEIFKNVF